MIDGLLHEVRADERSTAATAAVAAGATAVPVEDVTPFDDDGGQVDVAGVVYDYTGVDTSTVTADGDGGTLLLASPLTVAVDEFDPISVLVGTAVAVDFYAVVDLGEDDEASHHIEVPLETREERLAWPVRVYDPPLPVGVADDLSRLVSAPGVVPQIDAGVVDPATVELEAWGATPLELHNQTVQDIEADFGAVRDEIAAGDSANSQAIDDAVDALNAELADRPPRVESTSEPGATPNTAGTIWEQYDTLAAGQPRKLKAAWRGAGGTSWIPVSIDPVYIPKIDVNTGTVGSLAVSRLLVTDLQDMVRDPTMDNLGTWSLGAGMSFASYSPRSEDRTGQFLHIDTSALPAGGSTEATEAPFPVIPGEQYRCWMIHRRAGNLQSDGVMALRFYYYDKNMQIIPSVGYYAETGYWAPNYTDNSWRTMTMDVTVPNGVAFARCYPVMWSTQPGGVYNVDEVHCRRKNGGELIVDGSILARHVTADMVSGLLLSGRVLQTNTAAQRGIKMSDSGFVAYDSVAGSPTLGGAKTTIDSSTGRISAVGGLTTADSGNRVTVEQVGAVGYVRFWGASGSSPLGYLQSATAGWAPGGFVRLAGPSSATLDIDASSANFNGATSVNAASAAIHAGNGLFDDTLNGGGVTPANVNGNGRLVRGSSSSLRYKKYVHDLTLEEARVALDLRSVTFEWKVGANMATERRFPGFIAEEAHDAGAKLWVTYTNDDEVNGQPDGFRYSELTAAHNVLIKDMHDRIGTLEAENTELRDMVTALADRVAALEGR